MNMNTSMNNDEYEHDSASPGMGCASMSDCHNVNTVKSLTVSDMHGLAASHGASRQCKKVSWNSRSNRTPGELLGRNREQSK